MVGGGEDPQKLKRIAAAAYDYDNDPRWADYWSNVLLPPQMASQDDVVNHFKRKFYQRYIDPNLNVESMAASRTSQPERTAASQNSSSSIPNSSTRRQSSGASNRTAETSTTPPRNSASLRWDQQTIQFSVNAWVFVVAVLAMSPIIPKNLSNRAYRLSFLGIACSSVSSLYSLYGKPRAWNLQALQVWFQSVVATKDFIYTVYCLIFASSHLCLKFALIPILCRALEHVAKFLRHNFARSSLYRWQRSIIQAFMYWQLLKLMYHAPATAVYHQSAWADIWRAINPLILLYVPFLKTPISTLQRWWFR
ncbi:uncharacterized protein [Primulina huaijiensis]|uniref:uncharacterized protein isoform X2 n=1 Tax=Primulina huaijiensis TaxID=1492673 RepID=UPI003CC71285